MQIAARKERAGEKAENFAASCDYSEKNKLQQSLFDLVRRDSQRRKEGRKKVI
jgi:hypothetical protein